MPQFAPADNVSLRNRKIRRSLQLALFAVALLWYGLSDALAGSASEGLASRFQLEDERALLASLFLIFLLAVGYSFFARISKTARPGLREALYLPKRPSSGREWALGAAIGWGMAIAAILPMVLVGALHVRLWTEARAFNLLGLNLVTILFATLGVEVALRGFAFRRLIEGIGPGWATATMAILLGLVHSLNAESTWISIVVTMIGSVLFSLAWLRTHGLWLAWGLHFAWDASLGLLFGLPVRGVSGLGSVVQTRAIGATWFTGYDFGVEGALFTAIVLIAGIIVLVRVTDDYAWKYTRPEIIAAGYEVNPPPPAAHVAMEQEAAAKAPSLVQIQSTTPESRPIDE
ncbi:MAG: type II CAAX endopeptidase family protein [Granulicella sp.]